VSAIERIAYHVGRRDEVPNQELARELAEAGDAEGVAEIVAHLDDKNKSVASDCIKVLYEVGYIDPALIEQYVDTFIDLLGSAQNRMVWGGMIALWTVADARHAAMWERIDEVLEAFDRGSVITVVSGVKALAIVASKDPVYGERLGPVLFGTLRDCKPKLVATHAEDMLVMVNDGNRREFLSILKGRDAELSRSQRTRVERVLKQVG
jgi:hypothetical protein